MSQSVLTLSADRGSTQVLWKIFPCIPKSKYSKLELDLSNYLFNNDGCQADLHCILPQTIHLSS